MGTSWSGDPLGFQQHPIKHKPSLTPPNKIHIFRKRLRRRCHPPTTSNCSRTCKDTSNQTRYFPHIPQNMHQLNIAILEAIAALPPSTHNIKRSLTIRLLPPLQFLRKLLENLRIHIQSSASLPSHLPKYTLIKHCHFGSDCGAAVIHRLRKMIPHHQATVPPLQFLRKLLENSQRHIQSNTILPSYTPKYTSIKHHHFGSDYGAAAIHPQCQTIPHHQATACTSTLALKDS